MLKDKTQKYIESELKYGEERKLYHYNCAETLLNAANEEYNLELDEKTFKAITPFGGGFYCERTCGAFSGSLVAIGAMFTEDKPTANQKIKDMSKELVEAFEKEFGTLNCAKIKEKFRDEEKGCAPVMLRAAEVLERVLKNHK